MKKIYIVGIINDKINKNMRIVEEYEIKYPFSINSYIIDCYNEEFKKIETICNTKRNIYEDTYKYLMDTFENSKNENKKKCEIKLTYKIYILNNENTKEIYLIGKAFLNFEYFLKNKNYTYTTKEIYKDCKRNDFCNVDKIITIDLELDNGSLNKTAYSEEYYKKISEEKLKSFMDILEKAKNDNLQVCTITRIYENWSEIYKFPEINFAERKALLDFEYYLDDNKYSYTIKDVDTHKGNIDEEKVYYRYKEMIIDLK